MEIEFWAAGNGKGTWNVKAGESRRTLVTVASGDVGSANRYNAELMVAKAIDLLDAACAAGDPRLALDSRTLGGGSLKPLSPALAAELERAVKAVLSMPKVE